MKGVVGTGLVVSSCLQAKQCGQTRDFVELLRRALVLKGDSGQVLGLLTGTSVMNIVLRFVVGSSCFSLSKWVAYSLAFSHMMTDKFSEGSQSAATTLPLSSSSIAHTEILHSVTYSSGNIWNQQFTVHVVTQSVAFQGACLEMVRTGGGTCL